MTSPVSGHSIQWFFDFISPFAYLQWQTVKKFTDLHIGYRPVLFAGLLAHYGNKGPAELASKRVFTYRHAQWRAERAGVSMCFPPAHPFNPLAALRLCVAARGTAPAVDAIFNHIWRDGCPAETVEELAPVAERLGITDLQSALQQPEVKSLLRRNFDDAVQAGVFGVPTLLVDEHIFWGEDATEMFEAYMSDPTLFESPTMRRLATLPVATARREAT